MHQNFAPKLWKNGKKPHHFISSGTGHESVNYGIRLTQFTKFPSLVLIRLVLTEIQPFKNVKIYKEMYGHRTKRPVAIHFFVNFEMSNGCILLTIESIYTKLKDLVCTGSIVPKSTDLHPVPHDMKSGNSSHCTLIKH